MITLKPFKNSDADALVNFLSDERTYALVCGQKYGDYPLSRKDILAYYQNDSLLPFCACDGEKTVGHILIEKREKSAHLGSVIIDSRFRGKGYGRQLLCAAIDYSFNALKADEVTIGVFESNSAALKLYLSLGFKEICRENRFLFDKEDSYLTLKAFSLST